jgi:hypothetical protein
MSNELECANFYDKETASSRRERFTLPTVSDAGKEYQLSLSVIRKTHDCDVPFAREATSS